MADVDITGWIHKVHNVKQAEAYAARAVVDWGLKELYNKTANVNLKGPRYGVQRKIGKSGREYFVFVRGPLTNAGILPVPIVSEHLRKSIKIARFNWVMGAVWSDPNMAPYNKAVHDGTKRMKGRPYLADAVRAIKFVYKLKAEKALKAAMQKVGRAL